MSELHIYTLHARLMFVHRKRCEKIVFFSLFAHAFVQFKNNYMMIIKFDC